MDRVNMLVCGGRNYGEIDDKPEAQWIEERRFAFELLTTIAEVFGVDTLTHGNARGGDRLAARWASPRGMIVRSFPARWNGHKLAAGPIRNRLMYAKSRPDLVVALPGGNGTADMVEVAREGGTKVIRVV